MSFYLSQEKSIIYRRCLLLICFNLMEKLYGWLPQDVAIDAARMGQLQYSEASTIRSVFFVKQRRDAQAHS